MTRRLQALAPSRARRGLVMGLVVITAVVMAIAAYSALFVALSLARLPSPFDATRVKARFASEAGVVWATERLYEDARGLLSGLRPGSSVTLDSKNEPALRAAANGMHVVVTVTNTGANYSIESVAAF